MVGMRYIGAKVGPAGIGERTQFQVLQAKRAGMAASMTSMQSRLSTITSSLAQAQIDRFSGEATNAAQAGVDRINAAQKTAIAARIKRIDAAQSQVTAVQSRVNTTA
jgi:hypothetical protein